MDVPVFYDEIPRDRIKEEILKRNGETVLLADKINFSGSYFLCRLRIDSNDKVHYFAQMPIGGSEKSKALEMRLDYSNLKELKVKTQYTPTLMSRKYKLSSR